jgi:hypothetical protein
MLALSKSPEREAKCLSSDRRTSPGLVHVHSACRSLLVVEDPDECLVEGIPAAGFGARWHAVRIFQPFQPSGLVGRSPTMLCVIPTLCP